VPKTPDVNKFHPQGEENRTANQPKDTDRKNT